MKTFTKRRYQVTIADVRAGLTFRSMQVSFQDFAVNPKRPTGCLGRGHVGLNLPSPESRVLSIVVIIISQPDLLATAAQTK